MTFSYL